MPKESRRKAKQKARMLDVVRRTNLVRRCDSSACREVSTPLAPARTASQDSPQLSTSQEPPPSASQEPQPTSQEPQPSTSGIHPSTPATAQPTSCDTTLSSHQKRMKMMKDILPSPEKTFSRRYIISEEQLQILVSRLRCPNMRCRGSVSIIPTALKLDKL